MADVVPIPSSPAVQQTINQITPEIHKMEPITGFVKVFGVTINPMVIALGIVLCAVLYMLWKAQRDKGRNSFDVFDLFMDTLPNGTRRASGIKSTYQTSFILSSWVIVDQEIKGVLTGELFIAYLGTWCASLIAKVVFDKPDAPVPFGKKPEGE